MITSKDSDRNSTIGASLKKKLIDGFVGKATATVTFVDKPLVGTKTTLTSRDAPKVKIFVPKIFVITIPGFVRTLTSASYEPHVVRLPKKKLVIRFVAGAVGNRETAWRYSKGGGIGFGGEKLGPKVLFVKPTNDGKNNGVRFVPTEPLVPESR